jgi:hypothetical protein
VKKGAHPALFGLFVVPFGLTAGYAQIAVPYLLDEQHVPIERVAMISGVAQLPHAYKFLWAPALDAGARRRTWYVACVLATAAALALTAISAVILTLRKPKSTPA